MKKIDYLSTLFVGIDISSRENVVSAINFEQEFLIKMKPVPNTQSGADQLQAMLNISKYIIPKLPTDYVKKQ